MQTQATPSKSEVATPIAANPRQSNADSGRRPGTSGFEALLSQQLETAGPAPAQSKEPLNDSDSEPAKKPAPARRAADESASTNQADPVAAPASAAGATPAMAAKTEQNVSLDTNSEPSPLDRPVGAARGKRFGLAAAEARKDEPGARGTAPGASIGADTTNAGVPTTQAGQVGQPGSGLGPATKLRSAEEEKPIQTQGIGIATAALAESRRDADALTSGLSGSTEPAVLRQDLATPVSDPEFAQAFASRISLLTEQGITRAELSLNPPDMGPVRISIRTNGDRVEIDFQAAVDQTRNAIESSLDQLRDLLHDQGVGLQSTQIRSLVVAPAQAAAGIDNGQLPAGAGSQQAGFDQGQGSHQHSRRDTSYTNNAALFDGTQESARSRQAAGTPTAPLASASISNRRVDLFA